MTTTVGPASYFDPSRIEELDERSAELVRRRDRDLGPAYRLFYEQPVHVVRGEGVHLYDPEGNEYLDCYNNVPVVGHAHPRVTEAIATQAARLNTHTRYLHEAVLRYSEDLLATMPGELGHVMFSCTGSEAVDLALRIAKYRTGRRGVIVTRNAYHGVTTETASVSPSLGGLHRLADWVRVVDPPAGPQGAQQFQLQVAQAAADLVAAGEGVAALLVDSIFTSDGILPEPAGLLAPAVAAVRDAGGLYIADEVQAGFARTGEAMWGFQRHGVVPDLVTLGKPMGNGMPVAATVVRPEVVAEFGPEVRFFSTFGGNPVSIAAAQAVLDVIHEEDLQQHAFTVGEQLRKGLRELATRHPAIVDVRVAGLFAGVQLADSDARPATGLALAVMNDLRRRRLLIGTAGLEDDVLKIRPPLPFSTDDADRLVTELDSTLTALSG